MSSLIRRFAGVAKWWVVEKRGEKKKNPIVLLSHVST
jgi:hypothetical protein